MNIYCASFDLIRISGAENKLSREGVGVGVGGGGGGWGLRK